MMKQTSKQQRHHPGLARFGHGVHTMKLPTVTAGCASLLCAAAGARAAPAKCRAVAAWHAFATHCSALPAAPSLLPPAPPPPLLAPAPLLPVLVLLAMVGPEGDAAVPVYASARPAAPAQTGRRPCAAQKSFRRTTSAETVCSSTRSAAHVSCGRGSNTAPFPDALLGDITVSLCRGNGDAWVL